MLLECSTTLFKPVGIIREQVARFYACSLSIFTTIILTDLTHHDIFPWGETGVPGNTYNFRQSVDKTWNLGILRNIRLSKKTEEHFHTYVMGES
jgi:hypothetical protein